MTGGMAYLYDPEGVAAVNMNLETLVTVPVTVEHWEDGAPRPDRGPCEGNRKSQGDGYPAELGP
jgi:glutamate synthase domain-containing protein 3